MFVTSTEEESSTSIKVNGLFVAKITESRDEEEFENVRKNFCPVCLLTIAVLFGRKTFVSI